MMDLQSIGNFWARVERHSDDECWIWHGKKDSDGFGLTRVKGAETRFAHRISWILTKGAGVLHKNRELTQTCGNNGCVNPKHMALGELGPPRHRGPKRVILTVDITKEQSAELARQSVARGRSKAAIVRAALEAELQL